MGQLLTLAVTLTTIDCGECGGSYAINERFRKQCQDHGRSWTCPYCKTGWGFSGRGALQEAQRELEEEKKRLRLALARENEERAAKEKLARKLKRVGRGTCPECNRSFQNLARHMHCKHGGIDLTFGKPKLP